MAQQVFPDADDWCAQCDWHVKKQELINESIVMVTEGNKCLTKSISNLKQELVKHMGGQSKCPTQPYSSAISDQTFVKIRNIQLTIVAMTQAEKLA